MHAARPVWKYPPRKQIEEPLLFFFLVEFFGAEVVGAFEWNVTPEVPGALQIRLAIEGERWRPCFSGGRTGLCVQDKRHG